MNLSVFIGKRYVSATRGKGFVSFISFISVFGIAMGIIALIVVLSVMGGVTNEVRDKMLSMTAHAKVQSITGNFHRDTDISPYLKAEPDIVAAAPYIVGQGLIGMGDSFRGVQIKGIQPNEEMAVSDALENVGEHLNRLEKGQFNVVIGIQLALSLNVGEGDKITVVVPKTTMSAAGILPRVKRLTVVGFFESGHYMYDSSMIFMNIDDASVLFQKGQNIDGYQIKMKDLFEAQKLASRLNLSLPSGFVAFDWTNENKVYFDAVKTEKAAMFFILMIIVMVAAFNILSTLVMVVTDKQRDIAILRTIGASPSLVMRIFIIQGVVLGFFGTLLGVVGGIVITYQVPNILALLQKHFGFQLPEKMYFISEINPDISVSMVITIAISSMVLSFLATLYPAYKAATLQPARALAYE